MLAITKCSDCGGLAIQYSLEGDPVCAQCMTDRLVSRAERPEPEPDPGCDDCGAATPIGEGLLQSGDRVCRSCFEERRLSASIRPPDTLDLEAVLKTIVGLS